MTIINDGLLVMRTERDLHWQVPLCSLFGEPRSGARRWFGTMTMVSEILRAGRGGAYGIGGPFLTRCEAGGDLSLQLLQELIKYWGLEPGETYKLSDSFLARFTARGHLAT